MGRIQRRFIGLTGLSSKDRFVAYMLVQVHIYQHRASTRLVRSARPQQRGTRTNLMKFQRSYIVTDKG